MFTPKYALSGHLLKNITQIERLYGQLESLHIPKQLELNLERNNLIQSSYISNSIEGNPLSLPEVTNLLLDERIPVNRHEKEVSNYYHLLQNLGNFLTDDTSLKTVAEIHKKLLSGVNDTIAGQIRNKQVIIGNYVTINGEKELRIKHNPPFHTSKEITEVLKGLLRWSSVENEIPAILKIGIFHHEFVYIHPFIDGNGRVCRLLTALLFLQNKYLINKYFVIDDYYDVDRHLYSDSLHSADSGDKTVWLEYFSDGVKYSLQSALVKFEQQLKNTNVSQRPSPREKEVLTLFEKIKELTSQDIAEALHVSRQQAHSLVKGLYNKGLINKKGSTKGSYYFIK